MFVIDTIFDESIYPHKPLISIIYDGTVFEFKVLYLKNSGMSLYDVENNKNHIKSLFTKEVMTTNFKKYILPFNLNVDYDYIVYDKHVEGVQYDDKSSIHILKKRLLQNVDKILSVEKEKYQLLFANAQIVYQKMENKSIFLKDAKVCPKYDFVVTGRSKTTGYSIQGSTDNDDIYSPTHINDYFIHFDWIAADLRIAGIMSNDELLLNSFNESDPYELLSRELVGIERSKCKLDFLRGMYSLNFDDSCIVLYPVLHKWLKDRYNTIIDHGYSTTILKRRFYLNENNENMKTVFNAMFQGSIAHAMHSVLRKINRVCPENLFTETHDSVVLVSKKQDIVEIVNKVSQIMLHPFQNEMKENPKLPLKVSVGKKWKQWKQIAEYR